MGRAVVVADHQRRAPRDARARRPVRPLGLAIFDVKGRARSTRCSAACSRRWTSPSAASSTRPSCRRAAASAPTSTIMARRGGVPDRHRRRPRDGRPQALLRPAARRRLGRARGRHDRLDDDRALGRARATSSAPSPRRRLPRGVPVRDVQDDRDRLAARPRVADLLRRRPGLGALRPDRAGRPLWDVWSRRPARPDRLRDRGLRHDRPARRSATAPSPPSSRASTRSSRPAWRGPR